MWIVEKEGRKGKTERWSWLRSDGNLVGEEEEHGNCGGEKCWPRQKVKKGEGGQNEAGAGGAVGAVEKSKGANEGFIHLPELRSCSRTEAHGKCGQQLIHGCWAVKVSFMHRAPLYP